MKRNSTRLVTDLTIEEHRKLKSMVALKGMNLSDFTREVITNAMKQLELELGLKDKK